MQKIIILIFILILVYSCDTRKEDQPADIQLPTEQIVTVAVDKQPTYSTAVRNQWESYYADIIPNFSRENFTTEESFKIIRSKGTVTPIWDKKFNPVYKDFFAFNADSTQYIDFDSYKWGFDDKGQLVINPDQEIVLVNIPQKKVERILFYGPSFWVEDAYFKNDSVVVLLENSTDRIPAYQEINLKQNKSNYYLYNKSVDFDSEYYKNRISRIYPEMP